MFKKKGKGKRCSCSKNPSQTHFRVNPVLIERPFLGVRMERWVFSQLSKTRIELLNSLRYETRRQEAQRTTRRRQLRKGHHGKSVVLRRLSFGAQSQVFPGGQCIWEKLIWAGDLGSFVWC